MNTHNILKKVIGFEIEATTRCNAGCPGCPRYDYDELDKLNSCVTLEDITINEFKHIFHSPEYMTNKKYHFCGLLGDCISNKDIFEIFSHISLNSENAYIQFSTNGSVRNTDWWHSLGELSTFHHEKHRRDLTAIFAVDGHRETNHIYRRRTNFDKILENMYAYKVGGGTGKWMYIVFDHNEHEVEIAREEARKLGFKFEIKISHRNIAMEAEKMTKSSMSSSSTVSEKFKHPLSPSSSSLGKTLSIQHKFDHNIDCRWVDDYKLFVGANKTLWPCCYLYQSALENKEATKLESMYGDFNNLMKHDIVDILEHKWFDGVLKDYFYSGQDMHFNKCDKHCGDGSSRRDYIIKDDGKTQKL